MKSVAVGLPIVAAITALAVFPLNAATGVIVGLCGVLAVLNMVLFGRR